MRTLATVFAKEVVDNFRDRRALASALLFGPLLGPILFVFVINLSIERSLSNVEQPLDLAVIGTEHAPNLVAFLESRNIDAVNGPPDRSVAMAGAKTGEYDVVLVIPADFGDKLADGIPATVEIIADQANTEADSQARRVRNAIGEYSRQLSTMRLTARGINPLLLRPVHADSIDVSTPSGRSGMLLGMMSYFFLAALLVGGMYLAIDATAGERERGSMEPLLTLSVSREQIMLGKIAATCLFMALSLALCLVSFYFALKFLPLKELGMTPNFGVPVVIATFLILAPFILLGAALMTLIASFTKSYKEAQTWLTVVVFAPTMPILIVAILTLRPRFEFMFVPSLSQHLLLVDMVKNEPLNGLHVAVSVLSTLAIGALLTLVCARLYRREGLLG